MNILDVAKTEVGYVEGANNANKYSAALKLPNESWCADFVTYCAVEAGQSKAVLHSPSCIAWEKWAIAHNLCVPVESLRANDIVLFDFNGSKTSQHIGIVESYNPKTKTAITIEGNTSPSGAGSQANGDGVYRKTRLAKFIRAAIRPKWSA